MRGVEVVGITSVLGMMLTLLVTRRIPRDLAEMTVPGLATWLIVAVYLVKGVPRTTGSGNIVHGFLTGLRMRRVHMAGVLRLANILRRMLVLLTHVLLPVRDCILDQVV